MLSASADDDDDLELPHRRPGAGLELHTVLKPFWPQLAHLVSVRLGHGALQRQPALRIGLAEPSGGGEGGERPLP